MNKEEVTYEPQKSIGVELLLILNKFFKKSTPLQRRVVTVAWGLGLGAVWFFWLKSDMQSVIVGFFASVGFYEVIVKWFNVHMNKYYNNKQDDE